LQGLPGLQKSAPPRQEATPHAAAQLQSCLIAVSTPLKQRISGRGAARTHALVFGNLSRPPPLLPRALRSAMAPKSRLDALAGLPSDSDDDSSGGASGSDGGDDAAAAAAAQAPAAKKAKTLTIEDLQRAGYKEGPSVLFIKPPADEGPLGLSVSDGRGHKRDEGEDTAEARRAGAELPAAPCALLAGRRR